jgi:D-alanyl-lipoteichoic acid acyltransferase DltB (MBOAT superfamily)
MLKDVGDIKFLLPLLLPFLFYPLIAGFVLKYCPKGLREIAFATTNIIIAFALLIATVLVPLGFDPILIKMIVSGMAPIFVIYLLLVGLSYGFLRLSVRGGLYLTAAYFVPLIELVVLKYVPALDKLSKPLLNASATPHLAVIFIGISYVSFRLCYLVQEVQNGIVKMPSVWNYFSFAFYVPTLTVGPISPYAKFASFEAPPDRNLVPVGRSLGRIVVGLWKYIFVSNVLGQLGYTAFFFDGHPHGVLDLLICIFAYSIFLYCNFSGLCDLVIGVSGLLGIQVAENFNQPFAARNFQEFWSRWHMTLSGWIRDMMFTPLLKMLIRAWGPKSANHATAIVIIATFIVIGVWHGAGLNYLLFGISQGVGVAAVHYSTQFMRKRLGKEGFAKYRANRLYYYLGCVGTYLYFSLTLILFANSMGDLQHIGEVLAMR